MDFTFGLLNLKPEPSMTFDIIDFCAVQVKEAGLIDEDFQAFEIVGLVEHPGVLSQTPSSS